jgi:hypothetical protein
VAFVLKVDHLQLFEEEDWELSELVNDLHKIVSAMPGCHSTRFQRWSCGPYLCLDLAVNMFPIVNSEYSKDRGEIVYTKVYRGLEHIVSSTRFQLTVALSLTFFDVTQLATNASPKKAQCDGRGFTYDKPIIMCCDIC